MGCRKCGCGQYIWNPVSALIKHLNFPNDHTNPYHAYHNCVCGHHRNYHD